MAPFSWLNWTVNHSVQAAEDVGDGRLTVATFVLAGA